MSAPADAAASPSGEPQGRRVILWLFVGLALATFVTLMVFARTVDDEFRPRIYATMVGDLMAPVIAWQAFRLIEARREAAYRVLRRHRNRTNQDWTSTSSPVWVR